jgi:4-hydroxy-3-polyprenylbenzoate decarboxylase
MDAFVRALEQRSELVRIRRRVDPRLEIAAITDQVTKAGGPALLFEDVAGASFPLLINAFGSRSRMSLALGVDDLEDHAHALSELVGPPASGAGMLAELARKLPELAHVPPHAVASGACQDVVRTGSQVDLDALPILTCWPADGGPFITLPQVITRDPENGTRNVGCYRMQKLDRATTAMHWQVHKTGARHFRRARELGRRRLDVAVALGGDPALTYAATAPLPDGIDEWMFAGFLRKRAVATVRCKTVDLEVPADADFVLEGYVDPQEDLAIEGPFGDHTGYYTPAEPFPRFHVTAITHRAKPVFPATLVGPPPMEDAWLGKATERLFLPLLRTLFPEVVDMNLPIEGAFHNLAIISIKKQYPRHASRLAHGLWGAGQMMFSKIICVVDDDVDVQNVGEVAWRVLANLDPKRDLSFVEGPIDQLDHGADQALWGGKVCVDGTRKWREEGYTREWPEPCRMSLEVEARVAAIWPELGLPPLSEMRARASRAPRPAGHTSSSGPPSTASRLVDLARELIERARS